MTLGERAIQLIRAKGMTQKEFSEKTGIPQSTISDWKTKKLNPASDKILAICSVLEIDVYSFLSFSENGPEKRCDYYMVPKESDEATIIETYRGMNDKGRDRFIGYVDALKQL